ncbi:MAG: hypothetical protein CMJ81_07840 [Planctomycetaceae bacterium]|nr:hypothetical protein [Planctomycetaceae bacterium]MBP61074.1 hypothetical protein [Planctomycetaceae bacterium]
MWKATQPGLQGWGTANLPYKFTRHSCSLSQCLITVASHYKLITHHPGIRLGQHKHSHDHHQS